MTFFTDVQDFHMEMGLSLGARPQLLDHDAYQRRIRLILEELSEFATAHSEGNLVEAFDGLVDLTYVVLGTGVEMGLPFNAGWREVQRSNMSKVGGHLDAGGKFIKPPTYSPANLEPILEAYNER